MSHIQSTVRFTLALAMLVVPVVSAQADVIQFRQGGGAGYVDVTFDDTYLYFDNPDTNYGTATSLDMRSWNDGGMQSWHANQGRVALIGIQSLFDDLAAVGATDSTKIISATIQVTASIDSRRGVDIARMTSDWLTGANPGDSQLQPTWNHLNALSGPTDWAGGSHADYFSGTPWTHFSPSNRWDETAVDFDRTSEVTITSQQGSGSETWIWLDGTTHTADITDMLKAMMDENHNAGWVFWATAGSVAAMYSSEADTLAYRPTLIVEYVPEPASIALVGLGGLMLLGRRRVTR